MKSWKTLAGGTLAGLVIFAAAANVAGAQQRGFGGRLVASFHGTILNVLPEEDGRTLIQVGLDGAGADQFRSRQAVARGVSVGMGVRLLCFDGSTLASMPLGTVVYVPDSGRSCLVEAAAPFLDRIVHPGPGWRGLAVRDYLCPGAQVTISDLPL